MGVDAPEHVPGELLIGFEQGAGGYTELALALNQIRPGGWQSLDFSDSVFDDYPFAHLELSVEDDIVSMADELSRLPGIAYAEPSYVLSIAATPNDPRYTNGDLWGMHNTGQNGGTDDADIDAPEAWDVQTGNLTQVVGVIDTGIDYTHPDLYKNVWINQGEIPSSVLLNLTDVDGDGLYTFWDLNDPLNAGQVVDGNNNGYIDGGDLLHNTTGWEDNSDADNNGYIDDLVGWDFANNDNSPFDDNDHGTHVSGTIGGMANNNEGVVGVSWKVQMMGLKFLSGAGSGTTADAVEAVQYANAAGANLTSNSWGGGGFSQGLYDAIEAGLQQNMLFIAAAGNAGVNNDSAFEYPASYDLDNIISVAATDRNDQYANFSSYGAVTVDLAAPGVDTWSSTPGGSGYSSFSGTSMATPHVAGAAALLLSEIEDLGLSDNYAYIKSVLLDSVDPITGSKQTLTNGRLNAFSALGFLEDDPDPPAPIDDLASSDSGLTTVTLTWTATDDDGLGLKPASTYDVRYSTTGPITEANWDSATPATGEPTPASPGDAETFVVGGLAPATSYFFAAKVLDNVRNASALSTPSVSASTSEGVEIFDDDMEGGVGDWVVEGNTGLWHQATHRSSSPNTAWYYGVDSTRLYDTFGANEGTLTHSFDLTGYAEALLSFSEWSNLEESTEYDRTRVQASADGVNFTTIFESHDTQNWFTRFADLNDFVGPAVNPDGIVHVRFWFDTIDQFENDYEGWYIDDVKLIAEPDGPAVRVSPIAGLVTDEDGGSATFEVWLTEAPAVNETVTIGLSSSDTTEGTVSTGQLIFNDGNFDTHQLVTVTGVDDPGGTLVDGDISFSIITADAVSTDTLSEFHGLTASDVTVTNLDLDVGISIEDVAEDEGNANTTDFVFTVSLSSNRHTTPVTVNYLTADFTAESTQQEPDYVSKGGTLTFAVGETSKTVTITVNGDTDIESDETFFVNLSGQSSNATITDSQGLGTIIDDDRPRVTIDDVTVLEGDVGETSIATFTVSLSKIGTDAISVNYATADGSATTADDDYDAASGTLNFPSGVTSQTFDVTVNGDIGDSVDENFLVNLTGLTGTAVLFDPQGVGTIRNDDILQIVDDDDARFSTVGTWTWSEEGGNPGPGYEDDITYSSAGNGLNIASWTFNDLIPAAYDVSITWTPLFNRAINAPFEIFDGATSVFSTTVSQLVAPSADHVVFDGNAMSPTNVNFQILNSSVAITGDTLVVKLNDNASDYVIADAVRVQRVGAPTPDTTAPTADLADPVDTGTIELAVLNARGYIDVTFPDSGGSGLDHGSITDLGAEFTLGEVAASSITVDGAATLITGNTYRYTFTGDFAEGPIEVNFIAGSFSDNAGNLNIAEVETFTVVLPPPVTIIDDDDAGFTSVGSWTHSPDGGNPYEGYLEDITYSAAGNGADEATWTFTGLEPGTYDVAATWTPLSNRATDAPYDIFDNTSWLSSAAVNQQLPPSPDHEEDNGAFPDVNFQTLTTPVTITGDTLIVKLSDDANNYVIADAIRIERLGPTVTITESGGSTDVTEGGATDTYDVELSATPDGSVTVTVTADPQSEVSTDGTAFYGSVDLLFNDTTAQTVTVRAKDDAVVEGSHTSTITHAITSTADPGDYPTSLEISDVTVNITDNDTPPVPPLQIEHGVITVSASSSTTVNFTNNYVSPVIIATPNYDQALGVPAVARLDNITSTSFDIQLANPNNNALVAGGIHYIVVEEGVYTAAEHGVTLEAVKFTSTVTDENNSWVGEARTYANSYASPVVLGQVMSSNDTDWSVFWSYGDDGQNPSSPQRTNPPNDSLYVGKHVGEDPDTGRNDETIGYLVIEAGSGTFNGIDFAAAVGGDAVQGVTNNSNGYSYPDPVDQLPFVSSPDTAIVTQSAMDGGDGSWAVLYGASALGTSSIQVAVDEDQLGNSERSHTKEQLAYLVLKDNAAPVPTVSVNDVAVDEGDDGTFATATFTVTLSATSASDVTVDYATSNATATAGQDYAAGSGTVTIPANELSAVFSVTVNGDAVDEGTSESFNVTLSNETGATIADGTGSGTINDDDTAGVVINTPVSVGEDGTTDQYTIVLASQPTADVTITIDGGSQLNDPAAVTFTPGNWDTAQPVTVSAIDDDVDEGTHNGDLTHVASSTDGNYNGIGIDDVTATITDNDTAGVTISQTSVAATEGGTNGTYTVVLDSEPIDTVTVTVNGDSQASAAPATLTFNAGNWSSPQLVTVTAVNDDVDEGAHTGTITNSASSVGDSNYNAPANNVTVNITDNDIAGVTINKASVAVAEGGATDTYTVVLDSEPTASVTIDVINTDGQVNGTPDQLIFDAGNWDTPQQVTVSAVDDTVTENAHTGLLSHAATSTDAKYEGVTVASVDADITDNDFPGVTISKSNAAATEGGASDTYNVSLNTIPLAAVTVTVSPGNSEIDLGNGPGAAVSLTFLADATALDPQPVTITAFNDDVVEGDHTSSITHTTGSADANYNDLVVDSVSVNVTDDDVATFTIDDVSVNESAGTLTFDVSLTNPIDIPVTVDVNYTDGSTEAGDFVHTAGQVTFAAGSTTSLSVNVTINGDNTVELDESFTASLSTATDLGTRLSDFSDTALGTINDDDNAVISINGPSASEGSSLAFSITITNPVDVAVTADRVTADGSATTADADYTGLASANVQLFAADSTTPFAVSVSTTADTTVELDETLDLILSTLAAGGRNVTFSGGGASIFGTGTISNDDSAEFSVSSESGDENAGPITFTVTLSSAVDATTTVDVSTVDGTALLSDNDYTQVLSQTLTFVAGDTTETFTVTPTADTAVEPDETFTVNLSNVADGGRDVTASAIAGTGTILNDDAATVSINDVTVTEGDSGTAQATFTVSLDRTSTENVTVDFATTDGSATAGEDYVAASDSVTILAGQTTATIVVDVNGDTKDEIDETFNVTLSNAVNATIGDGSGLGTINDDDAAPSVSIANLTVTEGDSGTSDAAFSVNLSAVSGKEVTVDFATSNGTAVAGEDYTSTSGTLTIPAGQASGTIIVPIIGDLRHEDQEAFTVTLSSPSNATIGTGTASGTVNDNDAAPTISIDDVSVTEGDTGTTPAVFTVSLSAISGKAVSVNFATADDTATEGEDYVASSGTLTIPAGSASGTITVDVVGDTTDTVDETYFVNLSLPVDATIADSSGLGTILDNDTFAQIIDDNNTDEDGFNRQGFWSWSETGGSPSPGYQTDISYAIGGGGSNVATWTFSGIPAGVYDVAVTWTAPWANRATDAPFEIFDNVNSVFFAEINQELAPIADHTEGGRPFQTLTNTVSIYSDTLIVQLSDDANEYVIADAVRIQRLGPPSADASAPTADLVNPAAASTITTAGFNSQGYIDVTFADVGSGIDAASIDGNELAISGAVGTATLDGTATLVSANTYRYGFSGSFADGTVNVDFVGGGFTDRAGNANVLETESFTLETPPPPPGPQLQVGVVNDVTNVWTTVSGLPDYNSMVVVATVDYGAGNSIPMVARVNNVSINSFDVSVVRTDGGSVPAGVSVHYMVVEEGVYTVADDGIKMEAVKFNSTVTDRRSSWAGQSVGYNQSYSSPVVVGQVMTANDADWSVFWARGSNRGTAPQSSTLYVGKHVAEDSDTTRANEQLGYVVIETGSGTVPGYAYTAAVGSDIVRGSSNNANGYTYSHGLANASAAILSSAAMDGNDGAWPVLYNNSVTGSAINLIVDEDQIRDNERSHTTEQVAYLVFEETAGAASQSASQRSSSTSSSTQAAGESTLDSGATVDATSSKLKDSPVKSRSSAAASTSVSTNDETEANHDEALIELLSQERLF